MYQPKSYRDWIRNQDLATFNVTIKETDLQISACSDITKEATKLVKEYRSYLDIYIASDPKFLSAMKPIAVTDDAPSIVKVMADAAEKVGVGPMAAVAGAISQFVGWGLLEFSPTIIVENGGDIFISSQEERVVGIYAGHSPLSGRIGLKVKSKDMPLGICTSSGTVGHSLSFGAADASVVISKSVPLADAAATAIGNVVTNIKDIRKGLKMAEDIEGVLGAVIIKSSEMGVWGNVNIVR